MGTVGKALELLDVFTRSRPLIGLSDLARLAQLNKATCFRLVQELCDYGLLEQVGSSREYRLGPSVLRLAAQREAQVPTRDAAMPILQELANATGETAHMSLIMASVLRPLAVAYSTAYATRVTMEDTDSLPFHATSSGLAVLAFQSEAFVAAQLDKPLVKLAVRTETNPANLRDRIAHITKSGVAESAGAYETDVNSMAVPLFDAFGSCIGAVSVAAIASRQSSEQVTRTRATLIQAGRKITKLWGGIVPPAIAIAWQTAA